jgi:hypothetical protein
MKTLLSTVLVLTGLFSGYPARAQNWVLTSAPSVPWSSIASSADGTKLVAVTTPGLIYTSTNAGADWTATTAPKRAWTGIASSADGARLVAINRGSTTPVYTSSDSGTTWVSNSVALPSLEWVSIASSADGTKLALAGADYAGDIGAIYTSADSGLTWTQTTFQSETWVALASSADGNKLVAVSGGSTGTFQYAGYIWTSTNAGATWTSTSAPDQQWGCVASSADGSTLVAAVGGNLTQQAQHVSGQIYTSTNSGASWTQAYVPYSVWHCLASSADGTKLIASSGTTYLSTNSGFNWTLSSLGNSAWESVASSADGSKLVATSGAIYVSQSIPTPSLSLAPSGSNAMISWLIPSMDFTLQQNSDLTTTNWTDVTTPPVLNLTNLQNQVRVSATNGHTFYRLKH